MESRARRESYRQPDLLRADRDKAHLDATEFLDLIAERVAAYYGLPLADLRGRGNRTRLSLARHVAMLLMYDSSPFVSLKEIGRIFNGRDHSTVIYGVSRIRDAAQTDKDVAKDIADLRAELGLKERPE